MGQANPEDPAPAATEAGQELTPSTVDQLRRGLVDHLRGCLDVPAALWEALAQTPRHLFLPERVWHRDGQDLLFIDGAAEPARWLRAAYSPDTVITQRDATGKATSSCSTPYMVLRMIDLLDVQPGQRVLEIGTGTGWSSALLSRRLGDDQVVTVEVDPQVAEQARMALDRAGAPPRTVVGDGELGWPPGAPFDRVIATCAAHRVPYPWVEQTRPGGVIVTPWESPLGLGGVLRLTVAGATASGRFAEDSSFMLLRGQVFDPPDEPDDFLTEAATSTPTVDFSAVRENLARFVIGLIVSDCRAAGFYADDEVWLLAVDSWALINVPTATVRQMGRRRLWDEVESAYRWWVEQGEPDLTRFGLTVTRERQWVWLDEPGNEVGPVG